jgi:hypothetical protein
MTDWNTVSEAVLQEHICAWEYLNEGNDRPNADLVTDLAIQAGRKQDTERMIVHYIEPHIPYDAAHKREMSGERLVYESPFDYLIQDGSRERVWSAYLDELRFALDKISVLVDNIDSENVLITADHGECFGEWGMYGHSVGSFIPALRHVPLLKTTATDNNTYEPDSLSETQSVDVEDNLEALGYL